MDIRAIEEVIDHIHEELPVFRKGKKQLFFELIASFEDCCTAIVMSSILNPFALGKIPEQMDALNMALLWAEQCGGVGTEAPVVFSLIEENYNQCITLLNDYAYPYNTICSSYISYSRDRMVAKVDGTIVTFDMSDGENKSAWLDILREINESSTTQIMEWMNPIRLGKAIASLSNKTTVEDGKLCYEVSSEILNSFVKIATLQWDATKTLPETWTFDNFSLDEYKRFWIQTTALCYMHFFGCMKINDPQIRLNNSVIIQNKHDFADTIAQLGSIEQGKAEAIIDYITYRTEKKNSDIMYQPIVNIDGDMLVIAPMLFMGARPERNLLVLVGLNNNDMEHSKEVNDLENLMIAELEAVIQESDSVKIAKHKDLGSELPDLDFGILDKTTKTAIVCELKWFAAADSTKEVYAKEDEITHGCDQVEKIMGYALRDKHAFFNQVFGISNGEEYDLFCCVVAKHNIRTLHRYVPVISLSRIIDLLSKQPLSSTFHTIRNHEYEPVILHNATITYKETTYGGFTFRTPALCFGGDSIL